MQSSDTCRKPIPSRRSLSDRMCGVLPQSTSQVAILAPNWLGDVALALPSLRTLVLARPETTFHVVGRPPLGELVDLLNCPRIKHHECAKNNRQRRQLLQSIHPDAVIMFTGSFRSAWVARGLGRIRLGTRTEGRGWLLTDTISRGTSRPRATSELYADLVEVAVGKRPRPPQSLISEDPKTTRSGIVLVPGASRENKRWPESRFVQLGQKLQGIGHAITLLGSPEEHHRLRDMSNQILHAQVVCEPRLHAAFSAIQHAAVVVGNDTGPRHLATLFGTPCVSLFGPTDIRWTPPAANEHALRAQPFAPGELIADDQPAAFAIDRIPTGDVLFTVQRILDQSQL